MYAVAYTVVALMLLGGFLLALGIGIGLWLAVKAVRPELMEPAPEPPTPEP